MVTPGTARTFLPSGGRKILAMSQGELEAFKAELQTNRKLVSCWDVASILSPWTDAVQCPLFFVPFPKDTLCCILNKNAHLDASKGHDAKYIFLPVLNHQPPPQFLMNYFRNLVQTMMACRELLLDLFCFINSGLSWKPVKYPGDMSLLHTAGLMDI